MHIELSEALICPACGPDANLVLMVDRREGRWVRAGTLACSRCDARYPVRDGVIEFAPDHEESSPVPGDGSAGTRAAAPAELSDSEAVATEVAALLKLHRRGGVIVLGPGLAPAARRVAEMADRADVLLLAGRGGAPRPLSGGGAGTAEETGASRLAVAAGVGEEGLPVRARRVSGVALWAPDAGRVQEAARALAPGGRLVGLRPADDVRAALESAGLDVELSEERAFVATRPS